MPFAVCFLGRRKGHDGGLENVEAVDFEIVIWLLVHGCR